MRKAFGYLFLASLLLAPSVYADDGAWEDAAKTKQEEKSRGKQTGSGDGSEFNYFCQRPAQPICLTYSRGAFSSKSEKKSCEFEVKTYHNSLERYKKCIVEAIKAEEKEMDKKFACREEGKNFCP